MLNFFFFVLFLIRGCWKVGGFGLNSVFYFLVGFFLKLLMRILFLDYNDEVFVKLKLVVLKVW